MKKRVFIGIPASLAIQKEVTNWQREYLKKLDVRRIEAQNLHITLIPPWYEENIHKVVTKLISAKNLVRPFQIIFESIELGPKGSRPRLIWLHAETSKELSNLHANLCNLFEVRETRPFLTHMTTARWNPRKTKVSRKLFRKISWKMSVNKLCLYESKLDRRGAKYEVLDSKELQRKARVKLNAG